MRPAKAQEADKAGEDQRKSPYRGTLRFAKPLRLLNRRHNWTPRW